MDFEKTSARFGDFERLGGLHSGQTFGRREDFVEEEEIDFIIRINATCKTNRGGQFRRFQLIDVRGTRFPNLGMTTVGLAFWGGRSGGGLT